MSLLPVFLIYSVFAEQEGSSLDHGHSHSANFRWLWSPQLLLQQQNDPQTRHGQSEEQGQLDPIGTL